MRRSASLFLRLVLKKSAANRWWWDGGFSCSSWGIWVGLGTRRRRRCGLWDCICGGSSLVFRRGRRRCWSLGSSRLVARRLYFGLKLFRGFLRGRPWSNSFRKTRNFRARSRWLSSFSRPGAQNTHAGNPWRKRARLGRSSKLRFLRFRCRSRDPESSFPARYAGAQRKPWWKILTMVRFKSPAFPRAARKSWDLADPLDPNPQILVPRWAWESTFKWVLDPVGSPSRFL